MEEKLKEMSEKINVENIIDLIKKAKKIYFIIGAILFFAVPITTYFLGGYSHMVRTGFSFVLESTQLANMLTVNEQTVHAKEGYVYLRVNIAATQYEDKRNIETDNFTLERFKGNDLQQPEIYNVRHGFFVERNDTHIEMRAASLDKGLTGGLIMVFEIKHTGFLTEINLSEYKIIAFKDWPIQWEAVLTPATNL